MPAIEPFGEHDREELDNDLRSCSRTTETPRPQQAEEGLLIRLEAHLVSRDPPGLGLRNPLSVRPSLHCSITAGLT